MLFDDVYCGERNFTSRPGSAGTDKCGSESEPLHPALAWLTQAEPTGDKSGDMLLAEEDASVGLGGGGFGASSFDRLDSVLTMQQKSLRQSSRSRGRNCNGNSSSNNNINRSGMKTNATTINSNNSVKNIPTDLGQWINISPVIRQTFDDLLKTAAKQSVEITSLKESVKSLQHELCDKISKEDSLSSAARARADCQDLVGEVERRLKHVNEELELKADASFVTNCLLTKANKSDLAVVATQAERVVSKSQGTAAAVDQDKWAQINALTGAYREEFGRQFVEVHNMIREQSKVLNASIVDVQGKVADLSEGGEALLKKVFNSFAESQLDSRIRVKAREELGKSIVHQREFNDLVRQVETVAGVQSSAQTLMLTMQDKLAQACLKEDLSSLSRDKANKASVGVAIHRKANKDDMAQLEQRVVFLEQELKRRSAEAFSPPSVNLREARPQAHRAASQFPSTKPGSQRNSAEEDVSKKHLRKEVVRLAALVDEIQNMVGDIPDKEQVGLALDKLHEKVGKDIDSLRLDMERTKGKLNNKSPGNHSVVGGGKNSPNSPAAFGSHSNDALYVRLRATSEMCSKNLQRIAALQDRVSSVENELLPSNRMSSAVLSPGQASAACAMSSPNYNNIKHDVIVDPLSVPTLGSDVFSPAFSPAQSSTIQSISSFYPLAGMESMTMRGPTQLNESTSPFPGSSVSPTAAKESKHVAAVKKTVTKRRKSLATRQNLATASSTTKQHECTGSTDKRNVVKSKLERHVSKLSRK